MGFRAFLIAKLKLWKIKNFNFEQIITKRATDSGEGEIDESDDNDENESDDDEILEENPRPPKKQRTSPN